MPPRPGTCRLGLADVVPTQVNPQEKNNGSAVLCQSHKTSCPGDVGDVAGFGRCSACREQSDWLHAKAYSFERHLVECWASHMHMCFILFDSLMIRGDSLMVSHEPLATALVVHPRPPRRLRQVVKLDLTPPEK